jgi:hypothetical protein
MIRIMVELKEIKIQEYTILLKKDKPLFLKMCYFDKI